MIPDGATPYPHAVLIIQYSGVLITTDRDVTARHRIAELHVVQVKHERFADIKSKSTFHYEPTIDDHLVVLRHHRSCARSSKRKRLAVLVGVLYDEWHLEWPLGNHIIALRWQLVFDFTPLFVAETESVDAIQTLVVLIATTENNHRVLLFLTTQVGISRLIIRGRFLVFVFADVQGWEFRRCHMFTERGHMLALRACTGHFR